MIMPDNKAFEETRILETANRLTERDPDRIKQRMQDKFLAIAAGNDSSVKQWFVLRTAHRKENDVHKAVIDAGIEAWLPMKKAIQQRRHTRPSKEIMIPVFSGYLFVKAVSCAESWVGLSRIDGAVSLIFGQQGALVVSDKYMNDLMCLTDAGSFNEGRSLPHFKGGERVSYDLAGNVFNGVVEGYVGTRAARVLSFIFGQERVIEVPLANLKKSA
ncbi:transcription antitermination factor NusG [Pseudochrobactrum asaccharolyticum]|uniref:Transcription antitermination factor NusG n=2 Tax=Pseudochrobactrum asaccharolyticum TaxID=354351 RepID=A0A366DGU9_9HYPH|nr:transcription antitermination factor NusG [Pseudochrobactrum asaccharolyticum]